MRALLVLAILLLLAPGALAQASQYNDTISSFEEAHSGTDQSWNFLVTQEEATQRHVIAFLNPALDKFGIEVDDATGGVIYSKNGTLGLQTLPNMTAGPYKIVVHGKGTFQITDKALERTLPNNVSTTIHGGVDAYAMAPTSYHHLYLNGSVKVDWREFSMKGITLDTPVNRTVLPNDIYMMTLHGDEGTPYTVAFLPEEAPPARSPALEAGAVVAVALVLALALKRTT